MANLDSKLFPSRSFNIAIPSPTRSNSNGCSRRLELKGWIIPLRGDGGYEVTEKVRAARVLQIVQAGDLRLTRFEALPGIPEQLAFVVETDRPCQ